MIATFLSSVTAAHEPNAAAPNQIDHGIAAVCRTAEAGHVLRLLEAGIADARQADLLWLTWVQWRALGREKLVQETELSVWTVTKRLRQLRAAGVSIPSWSQELDLLARGRFADTWEAPGFH